jgi:hypothetical protein
MKGGAVALARNASELMRYWTLGHVVPYVNTSDCHSFNLITEDHGGADIGPYRDWLRKEFGLLPVSGIAEAAKEIIGPAIHLHEHALDQIFAP